MNNIIYLAVIIYSFLIRLTYLTIVYSPILVIAFYLTTSLKFLYSDFSELSVIVFIVTSYLIYCLIFFIKGFSISLKVNNIKFWILTTGLSILFTVGLPVLTSYFWFLNIFVFTLGKPDSIQIKLWSLLLSIFLGILVYRKYDFHKDICPKLPFWAYRIGFNLGLKYVKNPIDTSPDKGGDLF